MTRSQFGFAIGFAIAVVWAEAGFLIMIAAVFAGLLGYAITRIVESSPQATELLSRITSRRR